MYTISNKIPLCFFCFNESDGCFGYGALPRWELIHIGSAYLPSKAEIPTSELKTLSDAVTTASWAATTCNTVEMKAWYLEAHCTGVKSLPQAGRFQKALAKGHSNGEFAAKELNTD